MRECSPLPTNVLKCGLNFYILPIRIDVTKISIDWKRFEQSMKWTLFWYGNLLQIYMSHVMSPWSYFFLHHIEIYLYTKFQLPLAFIQDQVINRAFSK